MTIILFNKEDGESSLIFYKGQSSVFGDISIIYINAESKVSNLTNINIILEIKDKVTRNVFRQLSNYIKSIKSYVSVSFLYYNYFKKFTMY